MISASSDKDGPIAMELFKKEVSIETLNELIDRNPMILSWQSNSTVKFEHDIFRKFLTAEYYLESIFEDRTDNLRMIRSLDKEVIECLDGFIELLNKHERDLCVTIVDNTDSDDTGFLTTFEVNDSSAAEMFSKIEFRLVPTPFTSIIHVRIGSDVQAHLCPKFHFLNMSLVSWFSFS